MVNYKFAIDQTTKAIDDRARRFRNLIITVVVLALSSIVWAAVTRTFSPLSTLLFLFPICGYFFVLDGNLLSAWRTRLFDAWIRKEIDFRAFFQAVNSIPKLPTATLEGMLATLPRAHDLVSEQRIASSTREAVAAAIASMDHRQSDVMRLKVAAAAIVSCSAFVAVVWRTWAPLSGGFVVIVLPILGEWLKHRRNEALGKELSAARSKPDFSNEKYEELVASLQNNAGAIGKT